MKENMDRDRRFGVSFKRSWIVRQVQDEEGAVDVSVEFTSLWH